MLKAQICRTIVYFFLCFIMTAGFLLRQGTAQHANTDKANALIGAVKQGDVTAVARLLKQGADPNAREVLLTKPSLSEHIKGGKPYPGDTALIFAAQKDTPQIAELLIKQGAAVNGLGRGNNTPLMEAARYRNLALIKLLLKYKADPHRHDTFGNNAMIYAINMMETASVECLLKSGVNINSGTEKTLLMEAVHFGDENMVKFLLTKGADPNIRRKRYGTALDMAIDQNQAEIADILRKAGGKRLLSQAERKERDAEWERYLTAEQKARAARRQAYAESGKAERLLTDEDQQVLHTVLLDMLAYKGKDLDSLSEKSPPHIILIDTTGMMTEFEEGQMNAELDDKQANDITLEMREHLLRRNGASTSLKTFKPQSETILVWSREEQKKSFGRLRISSPRARFWVMTLLPGYSKQHDKAAVRFWFGPAPHGAAGTYFLIKRDGRWRVHWRDFAFYV